MTTVYDFEARTADGSAVKLKFLVDREGEVRSRFAPYRQPKGLAGAVEKLL